jgi:hypothetical protein
MVCGSRGNSPDLVSFIKQDVLCLILGSGFLCPHLHELLNIQLVGSYIGGDFQRLLVL